MICGLMKNENSDVMHSHPRLFACCLVFSFHFKLLLYNYIYYYYYLYY